MEDAGWRTDPTARHELRYFDGNDWSAHVSDQGQQAVDPFDTPGTDDEPTDVVGSEIVPADADNGTASPRRWPWVAGIAAAVVVGLAIGAAAQTTKITDLESKLTRTERQRDIAVAKVDKLEAQRRANLAKAAAAIRARQAEAQRRSKQVASPASPFRITNPPQLPDAHTGQPYSVTLTTEDGIPPYRWSRVGRLPTGLTFDRTLGAIQGTPTVAGTSSFTVRAAYTTASPRQIHVATQVLAITVT